MIKHLYYVTTALLLHYVSVATALDFKKILRKVRLHGGF